MSRFAFEPIYGSLAIMVLVALIVVAVIAMFTPETTDLRKRRLLIGLRGLAALGLLLAAFRPSLIRTDNLPVEATLVVAVDTSRSMTFPDGDGSDRWSSQVQAWKRLASGLQRLDHSLSVKLIAYDRQARNIDQVDADALDGLAPDGDLTDLSAAAAAALNAAGGQPMAGLVMMGDGTHTAPHSDDGVRRVAITLNALGVPWWSVPVGPAGGQSATRDVAIEALPETLSLFAGNEFEVSFQVLLRGLVGVNVPVQLTWIDLQGNREIAASRSVVATKASDVVAMNVSLTAPPPGTYRLLVEAETQTGEWVTQNNRQTAFVDVREGGGRILYIEGMPRMEQTFLRRSLQRFPDLDLTYRWIPSQQLAGDAPDVRDTRLRRLSSGAPSGSWPIDLGDRFDPGNFDIYILGDIEARALGEKQLARLAEAVAQGAGLIMLGGYQTFDVGGYADSPLAEVLPIRMDGSIRQRFDPLSPSSVGQLEGPLAIQPAQRHPMTQLGGQSAAATWDQLPPLAGANQWLGVKSAPGVQVLLESSRQDPLLVIGEYGRGRVVTVAFDSTWRWWRAGQSEVHRRFWRQMMLWVLSREETSENEIQIEIDARRFAANEPPEFRAWVESLGDDSTDVSQFSLTAQMINEKGVETPISVVESSRPAQQERLEGDSALTTGGASSRIAISGVIPAAEPGFYTLRVQPSDSTVPLESAELTFQISDESRELDFPMADPVYLRQLAELTADHGGGSFTVDEMDELLQAIAARRNKAEIPVVEKNRLGDGPISGWLVFLLVAGSLSIEWWLRRRWSMA